MYFLELNSVWVLLWQFFLLLQQLFPLQASVNSLVIIAHDYNDQNTPPPPFLPDLVVRLHQSSAVYLLPHTWADYCTGLASVTVVVGERDRACPSHPESTAHCPPFSAASWDTSSQSHADRASAFLFCLVLFTLRTVIHIFNICIKVLDEKPHAVCLSPSLSVWFSSILLWVLCVSGRRVICGKH